MHIIVSSVAPLLTSHNNPGVSVCPQGQLASGQLNGYQLWKNSVVLTPPSGWAAIGTRSFELAQFDNFAVTAEWRRTAAQRPGCSIFTTVLDRGVMEKTAMNASNNVPEII